MTHSINFYLHLTVVGHMFKDHIDNGLVFPISSKRYFISTGSITHTTAFVISVVDLWLEREIA